MAFNIFVNSTTADSADMNDNFYHIAQGTRLPMGGDSMAYSDSAYDIGSSTYKWDKLYCNNVKADSINIAGNSLFQLLSTNTLDSTTSRIEFTGLNGDNNTFYNIKIYITNDISTNTSFVMNINGDSSASYGYSKLSAVSGATATVTVAFSTTWIPICNIYNNTATTQYCMSEINLFTKSGYEKMCTMDNMDGASVNYISQISQIGGVYNNTSTITSIVFSGNTSTSFGTGTTIEIWGNDA